MQERNKAVIEIGSKYNHLTPIECIGTNKRNQRLYRCKCDCGNETIIVASKLKSGETKSCGCLARKVTIERSTVHGRSKHPLYNKYYRILARCYNPKNDNYKNYGGRGIAVCDEWRDNFESFYDWAIASGYKDGLTIDRIDVDGDYCPENCRWATTDQQANNKRTNIKFEVDGRRYTVAELSQKYNIGYTTLKYRLERGWEVEKALTLPPKSGRNRFGG